MFGKCKDDYTVMILLHLMIKNKEPFYGSLFF